MDCCPQAREERAVMETVTVLEGQVLEEQVLAQVLEEQVLEKERIGRAHV